MQALRDEPDVRRKIAMFVGGLAQRQERSARVQILIRDGRHVDDSLTPIWAKLNDEGLVGMTMLVRHLLESGQLREGIDLDEVRDVQAASRARIGHWVDASTYRPVLPGRRACGSPIIKTDVRSGANTARGADRRPCSTSRDIGTSATP